MYELTILYNHPEDAEAFDKHYREVHAPLAQKTPGLIRYTMNFCEPGPDGSKPEHHLIAVLSWDSKDEAMGALRSPEMKAATKDLPNFAAAGANMVFGETELVV